MEKKRNYTEMYKTMALIYDPTLSVWVITKSNSSDFPRCFNIKFEMYGKK